ncbi:MAG TPA: MerR family transcriptional regulator [Catalimonadaceae bacterium]|jgi:DNA-binding transcriptional MerR regulator|nr:MerR family transcriptional regulator [Catalimonadaceae bacterium]
MSEDRSLPDKMYFSIGEVARYFDVSTSLIRYWEDEFPHITPRKNGKGDRRYNKADIEKVAQIFDLIKEKKFTIRGAKAHLAEKADKKEPQTVKEKLTEIRNGLLAIKESLIRLG